jgi:single-strand DNA-binding protein
LTTLTLALQFTLHTMNSELLQSLLRAQTYFFRGRLVADPEIRYLESGTQVASARIAIDHPEKKGRNDDKQPDWLTLKVWFEAAQPFVDGTRKGQLIDVTGRVYFDKWEDKNTGEPRYAMALKVHSWSPVDTTAPPAPATAQPRTPAQSRPSAPTPSPATWLTSKSDDSNDEVPF